MPDMPSKLTFVDPNALAAIRGDAQRTARYAWFQERRDVPGADTTWLGPRQPLQPFAPPGTPVRMWDYPVGVNLQYQPKLEQEVDRVATYSTLRFFAQTCDVVRILIENRKALLKQVKYSFRLKYADSEEVEKLTKQDPRIAFLTKFFDKPDPVHNIDFDRWLNMELEDMLVVDAPALYIQRNFRGEPIGLVPVDGTTVKPLIGPDGGQPEPPAPAYQQVVKGVPIASLDRTQMLFYPRNPRLHSMYGYAPVEQILVSMNLFIRRQVSQLQFYTESNMPRGFLSLPPEWSSETQLAAFQGMLNALVSGNMPEQQRIMAVPAGAKYENIVRDPLTDQFDQWLAQVACFAFGVSPMPFLFMKTNRATAESARQQALQEGLGPFIRWVEGFLTFIVHQVWGWTDIEATSHDDSMVDPKTRLALHEGYQAMGVFCVNDIRADLARSAVKGGDQYFRTVGNQLIPVGGEDQPGVVGQQGNEQAWMQADEALQPQRTTKAWQRRSLRQRELQKVLSYL